jgi:hypothetical protein
MEKLHTVTACDKSSDLTYTNNGICTVKSHSSRKMEPCAKSKGICDVLVLVLTNNLQIPLFTVQ